jgi:hypothetical protein
MAMKKMLLLAMAMFLVGLFFGSVALAQDATVFRGTTMIGVDVFGEKPPPSSQGTTGPLAPSGGPSILLPAAALLLGTGVLTYTILRRRT